ncbi:MAG TPA: reverse transcriptase-like protein [Candidatus Acidoferrales bacterium]|jgi:acyl dehydratase/ribonuclease HI|nr:reverse transcriptase-like protein [Candidatus Acidoferrales bacterium]
MIKPTHKSSGHLFDEPEIPSTRQEGAYSANIDGAARGNPGPAAYGVIIKRPDGKKHESLGKYIGRTTNNVAEYYALIAALDYAAASGIRRLRVYSDSQLIVNQIKGIYKVKHPDLRPLHERAKKQAAGLESFTIQYVPREENRDADEMANAALDSTNGVKPAYGSGTAATSNPAAAKIAPPLAMSAPAAKALYLEDLHVGQKFTSGAYQMDEERIKSFAAEFDPQPFHLDEAVAQQSVFRGLSASGWHTAAATMHLMVTGGLPFATGLIGVGAEIEWPRPTRRGDTLRANSEILEITPSRSKPNQGIVKVRVITSNQNSEPVQIMTTKILVFKRTEALA